MKKCVDNGCLSWFAAGAAAFASAGLNTDLAPNGKGLSIERPLIAVNLRIPPRPRRSRRFPRVGMEPKIGLEPMTC